MLLSFCLPLHPFLPLLLLSFFSQVLPLSHLSVCIPSIPLCVSQSPFPLQHLPPLPAGPHLHEGREGSHWDETEEELGEERGLLHALTQPNTTPHTPDTAQAEGACLGWDEPTWTLTQMLSYCTGHKPGREVA